MTFVASPAAAYRIDVGVHGAELGPNDYAWLAAAVTLHLAATTTGVARRALLREATNAASDVVGQARIDAYAKHHWQGDRMRIEALMVLCDAVSDAGGLHLASVMLDDLLMVSTDIRPLHRGRALADRARLERKLGRFDEAAERYAFVAQLGRESGNPELEARAELGLSAISQTKGNFPEMEVHLLSALAHASAHGYLSLARNALQGRTLVSARTGRFEEALVNGWEVMRLSRGDSLLEAEALNNIGQLMLEAGHFEAARAGFTAVMQRQPAPARLLLNALGGLALASAHLGIEATVEWSVREVWRARQLPVPQLELATALLESGLALREVGRNDEAERYRQASYSIASARGFHEFTYRAEHFTERAPRAAPSPLRAPGAAVERDLLSLEPKQLPGQVEFLTAPA